jgi:hypothetical protein
MSDLERQRECVPPIRRGPSVRRRRREGVRDMTPRGALSNRRILQPSGADCVLPSSQGRQSPENRAVSPDTARHTHGVMEIAKWESKIERKPRRRR